MQKLRSILPCFIQKIKSILPYFIQKLKSNLNLSQKYPLKISNNRYTKKGVSLQ